MGFKLKSMLKSLLLVLTLAITSTALRLGPVKAPALKLGSRRTFVTGLVSTAAFVVGAPPSHAGIDPSALKGFSIDGDASGSGETVDICWYFCTQLRSNSDTNTCSVAASRLAQIDNLKNEGTKEVEYTKLESGVSFAEYREGR